MTNSVIVNHGGLSKYHTVSDWVPKKDSANFESDAFICFAAILKHPGSSRFGKEDPGYLSQEMSSSDF